MSFAPAPSVPRVGPSIRHKLYSRPVLPPFAAPLLVAVAAAILGISVATVQPPPGARPDAVPETVQRVLVNLGCHRPAGQKETITRGHFVRPTQDDWAALCVTGQSSFIYVVWGGTAQCPSMLATRRDTGRTLRTHGPDPTRQIEQDGIADTSPGSAALIHYCLNRSWVSLPGSK